MASQNKSKFRSILDYHVRDPLLDEVKDAISSMIAQFEQEHITSFISGLENLVVGIAKHFPSDFRDSCGGVHGTMKEVNKVRDDNHIHMDGADAQGVIEKHMSQQDCPSNNKRKRTFSTEGSDSNRSAVFYHRRRISRAQTQAQEQVGIDEAQPPVVNCGLRGINQVQIAVNQDSHGSIPDVADKDSRNTYVDQRIPACENVDASTSKQCGQTHNLNKDNNGRKDNSPSVVKSFDVSKGHTDQSPLRGVCEFQVKCTQLYAPGSPKQAITRASDNIDKHLKSSHRPKIMALYNWAPSFDLGIDNDDHPDLQRQSKTCRQLIGASEANFVSNVTKDITTLNVDSGNDVQLMDNLQQCNQGEIAVIDIKIQDPAETTPHAMGVSSTNVVNLGGITVIDIKPQDPAETTPHAMGVSSTNVINLDPPDIVTSSRERFDERCVDLREQTDQIYNKNESFVKDRVGCSKMSHYKTRAGQSAVNILQPLNVNVLNLGGGSVGGGSLTCKMPIYGSTRQMRGSIYTSHPYSIGRDRVMVSTLDMAYHQAVISMSVGEHSGCKAISVKPDGKTFVKYSCLGYSLKPEGKIDNFLVNCFCRLLFEENHPTKSKKHFFFNTVGQQILKPESEFRFANVKHEFETAHKVKSLQSCELIFFPILHEDHWFLFVVDIKDQKFVFIDSAIGGRSYNENMRMNLIWNFSTSFFATAKSSSINPLDFDFYDLSPHRQKLKKDSGVFVMKYMDIWAPTVALESQFTIDDIPKLRIQLLNRMLRSQHNLEDLSLVNSVVWKILRN